MGHDGPRSLCLRRRSSYANWENFRTRASPLQSDAKTQWDWAVPCPVLWRGISEIFFFFREPGVQLSTWWFPFSVLPPAKLTLIRYIVTKSLCMTTKLLNGIRKFGKLLRVWQTCLSLPVLFLSKSSSEEKDDSHTTWQKEKDRVNIVPENYKKAHSKTSAKRWDLCG